MSKKKANSTLPSELNENWGSNYMLDGFWHDMEYEHGLKENPPANPIPQPATSGMAQLPDGMIMAGDFEEVLHGVEREQEGGMDLEGLGIVARLSNNVDRSDAGVVDHTWLGDAYQDPVRLPNMPVDNGMPELQEAWGDRTDGIQRVDLYDRGAVSYEDALQHEEDDDPLNHDKLASLVRSAMRRSAAGQPLDTIKRALAEALHGRMRAARKILPAVKALEAEHGLVGNVYVRASAYPGLHQGKWGDALKKAAKQARYLVAGCSRGDCESCACALGLTVVAHPDEIDWNDAYAHYVPQLEATGRLDRTATVTDKRLALQHAFLAREAAPRQTIEPSRPRVAMPGDDVTTDDARRTVAQFKAPHRAVLSNQEKHEKEARAKAARRIGQMVKAHLLSEEEAKVLCDSSAPAHEVLKAAAQIALVVKTARYKSGPAVVAGQELSREAAWDRLRRAEARGSQEAAEVRRRKRADETAQKVKFIKAQVRGGLQGQRLAALIRETLSREEALAASADLGEFLRRTSALNPKAPVEHREYADAKFTRHVTASPEIKVAASEIRRVARWVRQQMSEGSAGRDLDQLIQLRLSPKVASASAKAVARERQAHEGLSGHVYVDAGAYASAEGTKGCDDGALRHRANGLKFVRAMDRCDGCVFKNADGVCQKYNKQVLDEIPDDLAAQWRHQNIASHGMTDQQETAAMFTVGVEAAVEAAEFGLHNAALDAVETEAPTHHTIEDVFFGGLEL